MGHHRDLHYMGLKEVMPSRCHRHNNLVSMLADTSCGIDSADIEYMAVVINWIGTFYFSLQQSTCLTSLRRSPA
jgi:hypothetical protein